MCDDAAQAIRHELQEVDWQHSEARQDNEPLGLSLVVAMAFGLFS
jgi:hypothetical protein